MGRKQAVAITVGIALLVFGAVRPLPAHAGTTENFILAGVALAAYVVFLVIGTTLVFGRSSEFAEAGAPPLDAEPDSRVRLGPRCMSADGRLPLACW